MNKSLPVILCDEEAVEGRHGCSIGKVDMENFSICRVAELTKRLRESFDKGKGFKGFTVYSR